MICGYYGDILFIIKGPDGSILCPAFISINNLHLLEVFTKPNI